MTTFEQMARFALPLGFLFVLGIGLWALGQWLRSKGYGERLDKIAAGATRAQQVAGRAFGPLSGMLIGVGHGLSRIPLLGNKHSRTMWSDLESRAKRPVKRRPF